MRAILILSYIISHVKLTPQLEIRKSGKKMGISDNFSFRVWNKDRYVDYKYMLRSNMIWFEFVVVIILVVVRLLCFLFQ